MRIPLIIGLCLALLLVGCGGGSSGSPVGPAPGLHVAAITPQTGGPGTLVTISGTGFGTIQGTSLVSFSGITAQATSWSDTVIVAQIPSSASSNGTFIVTVSGVSSNVSTQFTLGTPVLSSLSPSSGNPGTIVTLSGQYFGATQGTSYVAFNGQQATIQTWTDSMIICLAPTPTNSQSGNVSVVVVVAGSHSSNIQSFNLTIPTISNIVSLDGTSEGDNLGATMKIIGQGFGGINSSSNTYVRFNGTTVAYTSWSDTLIQFLLPSSGISAGPKSVVVVVNGQNSNAGIVNVAAPTITSITNSSGAATTQFAAGNEVRVTGKFFGSSTEAVHSILLQSSNSSYSNLPVSTYYWSDTEFRFYCPDNGYNVGYISYSVQVTVGGLLGGGSIMQID